MKRLDGIPSGKFAPIIGIAAREPAPFWKRASRILVCYRPSPSSLGYAGIVSEQDRKGKLAADGIGGIDISQIMDGDILKLEDDGSIHKLWETGKRGNCLFLNSSCDCDCLMCPQPREGTDATYFKEAWKVLNLLKGSDADSLCITGGEPTLHRADFLKICRKIAKWFPGSQLDILTNGKAFADMGFVEEIAAVGNRNVKFCVSLHGDTPSLHDRLTGAQGSFKKTCTGLYNLWNKRQRIEIRIVITRLNHRRLPAMADFLFNYMPFAEHYAFMGLEYHWKALQNAEIVGIEPKEYAAWLHKAVNILERAGLSVSIYNVPLCMCAPGDRKFARQSISEWKNFFPEICAACAAKADCCGFFSTSGHWPIEDISPIEK